MRSAPRPARPRRWRWTPAAPSPSRAHTCRCTVGDTEYAACEDSGACALDLPEAVTAANLCCGWNF
ncbi:MAG: hypothetical protein R3B09_13255 [Nannocystaceae bacterium]